VLALQHVVDKPREDPYPRERKEVRSRTFNENFTLRWVER